MKHWMSLRKWYAVVGVLQEMVKVRLNLVTVHLKDVQKKLVKTQTTPLPPN